MTSERSAASRTSADAVRPEDEPPGKEKTGSDSTPPRAGRTGSLGSRAERPADSRSHKSNTQNTDPGRDGKAPSPAAKDRPSGESDLPQAMRDATA
jgi:hypothetical protein